MGVNPPKLESKTFENGYRLYRTPDGNWYPSITTVLAFKQGNWLAEWKTRVGEDFAKKHSGYATRRGTILHKALENYIKDNSPIVLREFMPDVQQMLIRTVPILDRINRVILQEKSLYSDDLGIAGTPDLIAEFDGDISVIDFKNSYNTKSEDTVQGYFAQCTGYAKMLTEKFGLRPKKIVVIVAVEGFPTQVFEDGIKMKHYRYLTEAIELHNKNKEQPWQESKDLQTRQLTKLVNG
jgi:genome maintenance exonuclease 1